MSTGRWKTFWRNYSMLVVVIPSIVAIHYGWFKLQQKDVFVPADKQLHQYPHTRMFNYFIGKLDGKPKDGDHST